MDDYMKPPYTAELSDSIEDDSDVWVIDNEDGSVAEMTCPKDVAEATAFYLSRAGNAHAALALALNGLRRGDTCWCKKWTGTGHDPECLAATNALTLALAEKES